MNSSKIAIKKAGDVYDFFLVFLENSFRLVYGLGILVAANYYLTVSDFSDFAFYLSVSIFSYGVCKFSFDQYAVREIILGSESVDIILSSLAAWRLFSALIFSVLSLLVLINLNEYIPLLFLLILMQSLRAFDAAEWKLRAESRLVIQSLVRMTAIFFSLLYLIINVVREEVLHLVDFITAYAIEWSAISILYFLIMLSSRIKNRELSNAIIDVPIVKKILSMSFYSYASYVLFLVYSKADQFILKLYVVDNLYGSYMIAARMVEASIVILMSVNLIIFPKMVLFHEKSKDEFERFVREISIFLFCLSVFIVIFVWVCRINYEMFPAIIERYIPYEVVEIFSVLSFVIVPMFVLGLRSSYFAVINKPVNILVGSVCGFVSLLFLGVPLISGYGIAGAVLSLFFSTISALFLSNFFSCDGREFLKTIFSLNLQSPKA